MLDKVSIVIPTYNESRNLPIMINRILCVADKIAHRIEIVIVDDNSPDGTGRIADDLALKHSVVTVIHRPRRMGVGSAFFDGVKAASASDIVMMDADLHHRPEFIPSITRYLPAYDIVIASRFVKGSSMEAASMWRRLATRSGNTLARYLLRLRVRDYTHGFRGYRRSTFLECYDPEDTGGEYNIRLLIEASKRGFSMIEVPYDSEHVGNARMKDWLKYLWLLVREYSSGLYTNH